MEEKYGPEMEHTFWDDVLSTVKTVKYLSPGVGDTGGSFFAQEKNSHPSTPAVKSHINRSPIPASPVVTQAKQQACWKNTI